MIRTLLLLCALTLAAAPAAAEDQTWPPPELKTKPPPVELMQLKGGGAFGLGLNVGSRTGLTLKIWPRRLIGITVDAGATPFTNTLSFAVGTAFHARPLRGPNGISAQLYAGVGFRTRVVIDSGPDPEDEDRTLVTAQAVLGLRVPIGLTFLMSGFPVELFVEAAPAIDVWQAFGVDVEGIGGARVYF